jgi:hypothetical protein
MKLNFIFIFFWGWAIVFIKISICLMLLRIKNSPLWKWGFATMMLLQFACGTVLTINLLLGCQPIQANWNRAMPGAKCWSAKMTGLTIYPLAGKSLILACLHLVTECSLAVTVATDALCALLPIIFIVQIKRPTLEKSILGFIMGLGLLASALGIAKIFAIKAIQNSPDPLWQNVHCMLLGLVFLCNICCPRN